MSAQTLRELLDEVVAGRQLDVPILIAVHARQAEGSSDLTLVREEPLDWIRYTGEYGDCPFVLLGRAEAEPARLGRSRQCEVRIDDESVSKHHATLRFDRARGEYLVIDESSRNGTCVNGQKLYPGEAAAIWSGAYLTLGDAVFVFIEPPALRRLARTARSSS